MKLWHRRAALLVCATLSLLALPAFANAKPGYVVLPGSHEVELELKGSNGYAISISRTNHRPVVMFVSRNPGAAIYLAPHARSSGNDIEARFPGVGRVSVRFHPTGAAHKEQGFFPPCR